jgi:hypothetical protein
MLLAKRRHLFSAALMHAHKMTSNSVDSRIREGTLTH